MTIVDATVAAGHLAIQATLGNGRWAASGVGLISYDSGIGGERGHVMVELVTQGGFDLHLFDALALQVSAELGMSLYYHIRRHARVGLVVRLREYRKPAGAVPTASASSSATYTRHALSSRLARRAPRPPHVLDLFLNGPLPTSHPVAGEEVSAFVPQPLPPAEPPLVVGDEAALCSSARFCI